MPPPLVIPDKSVESRARGSQPKSIKLIEDGLGEHPLTFLSYVCTVHVQCTWLIEGQLYGKKIFNR